MRLMEEVAIPPQKATELEKDLERKFKRWVESHGGWCLKFTPFGLVGIPDRIVMFRGGILIWVELKRAGKTPTSMQYYRLAMLRSYGQAALWGASLESLTHQIGEICKANGYSLPG